MTTENPSSVQHNFKAGLDLFESRQTKYYRIIHGGFFGGPTPEEQQAMLPWQEVGFRADAFLRQFGEKLPQSSEFLQALCQAYVRGQAIHQQSLAFQRGDYHYKVDMIDRPDYDKRNLWLSRTPVEGFDPKVEYAEHLHIDMNLLEAKIEKDPAKHKPYVEYETRDGVHEINTQIAIDKAQEIIANF